MIAAIKARAVVCFCLVHIGLALAVGAFIHDGGMQLSGWTLGLLLAGVAVMYSGFLFAVLSVWVPMRPWLKRYQRARDWRGWILHELPTILALIPVLVSAIQLLRSAWRDVKEHQSQGDLGIKNLAAVAQKFADQADELSRDPSIERVKRKIRDAA